MALINKLNAIGDAIREKTGKTELLTLEQMPIEIAAIETGGGGGDLPEEAYLLTGNCQYRFANNGWNWFIENYGKKIKTENVSQTSYMFANSSELEEIPFDINITSGCKTINYIFSGCYKLKSVPLIKGTLSAPTGNYSGVLDMGNMFVGCWNLQRIPYDFFRNFGGDAFWEASKKYRGGRAYLFDNCYSLRQLPDIGMLKAVDTSPYALLYYTLVRNNYVLDEIINLPVIADYTGANAFYYSFDSCRRLKELIFETNEDGTPIATQWKNQTIDLSKEIGFYNYSASVWDEREINHAPKSSGICSYNSGITADKMIYDEATYAALKDNPDAFCINNNTNKNAYSRYNHDSAVNTINSLPSTNGTGCTIKFVGTAGSATDGGAINTLTEAEIAVAAAKGWTVTLV